MASTSPMLERWSLGGGRISRKTFCLLLEKQKQEFRDHRSTKKIQKNGQHSLQGRDGDGRSVQTRLSGWKALPFDPKCFQNLQPEILPYWKAPLGPVVRRLISPGLNLTQVSLSCVQKHFLE